MIVEASCSKSCSKWRMVAAAGMWPVTGSTRANCRTLRCKKWDVFTELVLERTVHLSGVAPSRENRKKGIRCFTVVSLYLLSLFPGNRIRTLGLYSSGAREIHWRRKESWKELWAQYEWRFSCTPLYKIIIVSAPAYPRSYMTEDLIPPLPFAIVC